jgi:hypothetical protein
MIKTVHWFGQHMTHELMTHIKTSSPLSRTHDAAICELIDYKQLRFAMGQEVPRKGRGFSLALFSVIKCCRYAAAMYVTIIHNNQHHYLLITTRASAAGGLTFRLAHWLL